MNPNTQPRTLESVRAAVLESVPVLYRPTYARAFGGKSKAAGIKAMCLSCAGNVRAEVTACTVYACPLFEHRPYQAGATDDATGEHVDDSAEHVDERVDEPTAKNQVVDERVDEGGAA